MLRLSSFTPGVLLFEFSPDSGYVRHNVIEDGLFIRDFNDHSFLIEEIGAPGVIAEYVARELAGQGLDLELDSSLTRIAALRKAEKKIVTHLRNRENAIAETPTFVGTRTLLPFQKIALAEALQLTNPADFSVPGSGKTTIALGVYDRLRHEGVVEKLFVVGPASSFDPWEEEYADIFKQKVRSLRLVGPKGQRRDLLQDLSDIELILCTYHVLVRDSVLIAEALATNKTLLVLDESHYIKNFEIGPWVRAALDVAQFAERRMILTGTPAPNSLKDLWTQFTFLWPSQVVLGSRSQYEQAVSEPNAEDNIRTSIRPFFVRVKKSSLGLPKPNVDFPSIDYHSIPSAQRLIIRLLEMQTLKEAREVGLQPTDVSVLRQWRRARILRLMQAASNPALLRRPLDDVEHLVDVKWEPGLAELLRNYTEEETPAKIRWFLEKAEALIAAGHKVVIWANFVQNLKLLERRFQKFNPLLIHGAVPPYAEDEDPQFESRERNIRLFKESRNEYMLLIANPAACADVDLSAQGLSSCHIFGKDI